MKAYITTVTKDKRGTKEMTLERAKTILTTKQFEKLISFEGLRTKKISGYIA